MNDIERKLAALGRMEVEGTPPPVRSIAKRAKVRKGATVLASLSVILVVGAAGFAGVRTFAPETERANPSLLAAAAVTTREEGTARMELETTILYEGDPFALNQDIYASGEIDFEANRSHLLVLDVGVPGRNPVGGNPLEVIQDGTTFYSRGDPIESPDEWVRTELTGSSSSQLVNAQGPDDYLESLNAISERPEKIGEEELRGEAVTRYRVIVDSGLFLETLASEAEFPDAAGELDAEVEPIEVWVDSEGRVRRMDVALTMTITDTPAVSVEVDTSFRLFDFGVPVDIEIPDLQDVAEVTPPPSVFSSPEADASGAPDAVAVVGDDGFAQPYVAVIRRAGRVCFFEGPAFAAGATLEHEPTGEDLVTFEEDEIFVLEAEEATGCDLEVSKNDISDLLESPNDYLLRIGGGFPPRVVYFTEVITDP